jgi:hypothetical protein
VSARRPCPSGPVTVVAFEVLRRVAALLTVAVVPAMAAAVPTAASAQARVLTDVDTTLVTVGDRVTLTVRVEHAADETVVWPDSLDLAPFEVLGARLEPVRAEGGRAVSGAVFALTAFELGELEVPSFGVTVLRPDGSREEVETDRFGIEVVSVGTEESGDIHEIRGPLSIPVSGVRIALWGLLFMLLGAALLVAWRKWRERHLPLERPAPGPPPRPAHEVALEALDRLDASSMLELGQVKEYHIEASDIVRRYVEQRYRVPALEMTTWEVLEGLERAGVGGEHGAALGRFLDPCDMVKFAKVRPTADASRAVLALGRVFVEASVPAPAPVPVPAPGDLPPVAHEAEGV